MTAAKPPPDSPKTVKSTDVLVEGNRFTPFGAIAEDNPDQPVIGAPKDKIDKNK